MRTLLLATTFILLSSACGEDRCVETRSELALDEAGSWASPAEIYAHVEGPRAGTITWLGGAEAGELTPAEGESPVTLSVTLDPDSAVNVDLDHLGDGRLACIDRVEMRGVLTITSDDGALAEELEIELSAEQGVVGGYVGGSVDLSAHPFAGSMEWAAASTDEELRLYLSWVDDADQTLRGWLVWADATTTTAEDDQVEITGSGRVLAELEATLSAP